MTLKLFNKDFFRNFNLIFKPKLLLPNAHVNFFEDVIKVIDDWKINHSGFSIILDVDQTILAYKAVEVKPRILKTLNTLKENNNCCILSNYPNSASSKKRLDYIENKFGITVIRSKVKKPDPEAFKKALAFLESNVNDTIMIGDRIFTDIIGANNMEIKTILVDPIDPHSDPFLMVTLPRKIENIIYNLYKYLGVQNEFLQKRERNSQAK